MANPQKEYIEDGYIMLSRKIFNSKTFSGLNAIQKLMAIYFILMANHQNIEWWDKYQKKFVTIKRGSFITSILNIKKKIKDKLITTKKIRTCIELLENMQFLAREKAKQYTHITIINYDYYQDGNNYKGKALGKARARQGQGKGKARAINKNGKNGKNGNNKYIGKENITKIPPLNNPLLIEYIYNHWNKQKIIIHKNINNYRSAIKAALNKYDDGEIEQAIVNYGNILKGEEYYFNYKWTLNDFLKRGIDKFLDLEIAKNNYKKGDNNGQFTSTHRSLKDPGKDPGEDKYKHLEETYEV